MSQFTFATLVKEEKSHIASYIEKSKLTGYLFPVNPKWCAVIIENDKKLVSKTAKKLSQELNTVALYFFDFEDHGWGFSLYESGKSKGELHVDYEQEQINKEKFSEETLLDVGAEHTKLLRFIDWVAHSKQNSNISKNGVNLFKEAFDFNKIDWVSYDYLSNDGPDRLEQLKATSFSGKKKNVQVKKVVINTLQKPLNQLGYYLDEGLSNSKRVAFLRKDENGYSYGLIIDAMDKGALEPFIYSPTVRNVNLYLTVLGQRRSSNTYKTESELVNILEDIGSVFITNGHEWLQKNTVKVFDVNSVYEAVIDPYLNNRGFNKVHEDSPIMLGGKLIYESGQEKIVFEHFPATTGIKITLVNGNQELGLNAFLHQNRGNPQLNIENLRFDFTSKADLTVFLTRVIGYIEYYLNSAAHK